MRDNKGVILYHALTSVVLEVRQIIDAFFQIFHSILIHPVYIYDITTAPLSYLFK